MNIDFWITVSATKSRYGNLVPSVPKASRNKPSLSKNAVAVKVTFDIPDDYFELPELKAKISLPDMRRDAPEVMIEMSQRAADELSKQLGVNVNFEWDEPDNTENKG
jgi:hypothetical protein